MEDAQIYGHSICENGEEDYIELEVIGSNSTLSLFHFKNSIPSPPQPQEFEFQMLPSFIDRNTTSSTADELFYNGKLLPLDHIPLHNNPISNKFLHVGKRIVDFEQSFSTPFFQSCNVSRELNNQEDYSTYDETSRSSKSLNVSKRKLNQEEYYSTDDESSSKRSKFLHVSKSFDDIKQSFSTPFFQSCHVSRELNHPQDCFFGYSTDDETSKRPKWSKGSLTRKLKLIKQLSFDHSRIKCLINNSVKLVSKKEVFGRIHHHSRKSSFSGAIKRLLTAKSSSSSSSTSKNSNGNNIQEMHLLMRNMSDMYAEVDPIQAAIAHCKNSHHQQQHKLNSLVASKMIFQEQERTGLCRG
ncbi:hypothetical protein HAX54_051299 [Datura stramonium]|uniref:Uncharacterized protein n=1 Tax=Datura stramonium TaxID=4076 RepID=A0ABS8SXH3_DATST|nr:hypothetical protein [Datura stramonium]